MSFDPFQEKNPARDPVPRPALDSTSSTNSAPGENSTIQPKSIRDRLTFPAVLLILSGIVNILFAGYLVINSIVVFSQTPEQMEEAAKAQREAMIKLFPQLKKELEAREQAGETIEDSMTKAKPILLGLTGASLLVALLTLFAGVRMLQLRNYGLVMIGSLLSAIPCVSGASCPCCVGAVAGVYSVILLLQPDIRDAFR